MSVKDPFSALLNNAREKGVISRAVIGVTGATGTSSYFSIGQLEEKNVSEKTVFDIASVTKVVPVSALALLALDRKLVTLDTAVEDLHDEIKLRSTSPVLFRHLLTQTLDFQFSLSAYKNTGPDEILKVIQEAELKSKPGDKFFYCNATSILLGRVVERIFNDRLDILAEEHIFNPLGMKNSLFRPSTELRGSIVPTEIDSWRMRTVCGEIHDESSWVLNKKMIPGAAGLFTTAEDLVSFIGMLTGKGKSLYSQGFINECAKDWIPEVNNGVTGLGFEFDQPYMGAGRSGKTIGKTGFTGSVIVADLDLGVGFTLLTDYTWPKRKNNRDAIMELRKKTADLVWEHFS